MRARAPGKIILSGEHAVVYGAPAIASAIKLYTEVSYQPIADKGFLRTTFSGISNTREYAIGDVAQLGPSLDRRYQLFTDGSLSIQELLTSADQLLLYVFALQLAQNKLNAHVKSASQLPVGAGMGSSAAAIAAAVTLTELISNQPLENEQRYQLVRYCERLQHGRGSLIDAATVTLGGIVKLENDQISSVDIVLDNQWYWVSTGTPECSTGECVSFVKSQFGEDFSLWGAFSEVTFSMVSELRKGANVCELLKENQRLLSYIGVVPPATKEIIAHFDKLGAAAKVSGAGAYKGGTSGLLLVYANGVPEEELFKQCALPWGRIEQDNQGAVCV